MAFGGGQFDRRISDLRSVLALRAFRLFSIGNFCSLSAIWVVRVCIGWLTWELTGSKTWLGIMAFAELGPSVIVSLYAGDLADRIDRVRILRMGQGMQACLALGLLGLKLAGALTVWWMLVILLGFSILGGINLPARMSMAPVLVSRDKLATASAVGSITLNLTRLLGPLVAAPLLMLNQEPLAFALAALGFAINAICLSLIRPEDRSVASVDVAAGQVRVGFVQVMRDLLNARLSRLVLVIQFAMSLLVRPLTDMFPAFSGQVFARDEAGYAMLTGCVGIGAICGAWFVVGQANERAMRWQILFGSVVFALSMIAFGLTGNFWLALLVLLPFGAAMTSSGIAGTTFIQIRTPHDRLGRVMSLYSIVYRLAPALGALAIGALADLIGLGNATILLPAIALALLALVWRDFMTE